jgi:hypothetical protein
MRIKSVIIFSLLCSPLAILFALFPKLSSEGLALETSVLAADVESYSLQFGDYLSREFQERFAISKIVISGDYRCSERDIAKASKVRQRQLAWDISLEQTKQNVESLPWIKSATVSYDVLPMRLLIEVKEVEPWIVAKLGEESWLVSDAGTLIEPLSDLSNPELVMETSTLPRLQGLSTIKIENSRLPESLFSSANARFHYAVAQLKLLEMAETLDYDYELVRLQEDGSLRITAVNPDKSDVILRVRSLEQAKSDGLKLRLVTQDLAKRGEKPNEIDLRFSSQAVVR